MAKKKLRCFAIFLVVLLQIDAYRRQFFFVLVLSCLPSKYQDNKWYTCNLLMAAVRGIWPHFTQDERATIYYEIKDP